MRILKAKKWRGVFPLLVVLGFGFIGSGCAGLFGPRVTYSDTLTGVAYPGNGMRIAVASQDRREYVVSGQTEPEYVGQSRSKFGIPFHRRTGSGRPLATALGQAAAQALIRGGFSALATEVNPKDSPKDVRSTLVQAGGQRLLVITIHEWMYDRYRGHTNLLTYKLEAEVLDAQGQRLASATREDERQIRQAAVLEYANVLMKLLNDSNIAAAMR